MMNKQINTNIQFLMFSMFKILRVRNLEWDFLGVNCNGPGTFLGFVGSLREFFGC